MSKLAAIIVFLALSACSEREPPPMSARLIDSLYVSGAGSVAASGSVSFYQPGTLVPVPVFSDDAMTQVQTQPIVLDASGKTPLPVYTASPLRAVIRSAAGTVLQDIARIDGDRAELVGVSNPAWSATDLNSVLTAIRSSLGGTDARFLDGGIGAVSRNIAAKFAEVQISVKDYGAVGNGIADDTVAIQAAINRVIALGGGTVFVPPGTCLISSALSVPSAGVTIVGAGQQASIVKQTNATADAIAVASSSASFRIANLRISHSSTSTGNGITFTGNSTVVVDTVIVDASFRKGISIPAANSSWLITNSSIGANSADVNGVAIDSAQTGGQLYIVGSLLFNAQVAALRNQTSGTVLVASSVLTGITAAGISIVAGTFTLTGSVITGATDAVVIGSGAGNISIGEGNVFIGDIVDGRTGSPVGFSLSSNGSVTPLPLKAPTTRIIATAAITVTVNAIVPTGWGRRWTLMCINSSGGAVTWTFNAQYVLSAAVNPATGNMVNLLLEYDPISAKVREIGRAATAI